MIDRELCQIDALLADIGRERLEARGVVGIEDANRLAKLVPTKDWIPIDAQINISNIPSLIKKLGGNISMAKILLSHFENSFKMDAMQLGPGE